MQIGIIGRQPQILQTALAAATDAGHNARGTLLDDEALAWLRTRDIEALIIGGGVEPASRAALARACAEFGIKPVEVFGPENLRRALASLG